TYLLADWSQNPEEELLSGERRRVLDRAIDGLPDHYRVVLVLRDVEDLSNEEVATILEEPVSSVKSRLHRARMVLREQLMRTLACSSAPRNRTSGSVPRTRTRVRVSQELR